MTGIHINTKRSSLVKLVTYILLHSIYIPKPIRIESNLSIKRTINLELQYLVTFYFDHFSHACGQCYESFSESVDRNEPRVVWWPIASIKKMHRAFTSDTNVVIPIQGLTKTQGEILNHFCAMTSENSRKTMHFLLKWWK